jgi:hypothetical protein
MARALDAAAALDPGASEPAAAAFQAAAKQALPRVEVGAVTISGRLTPEKVLDAATAAHAPTRACYVEALRRNPDLQGRLTVRFLIGRDGAASSAGNGGSDVPDAELVACGMRAFEGLSFPVPERGIVTVVYPLLLSPAR